MTEQEQPNNEFGDLESRLSRDPEFVLEPLSPGEVNLSPEDKELLKLIAARRTVSGPIELGREFWERVAEGFARTAETMMVQPDELAQIGRESAKNTEESYGFSLDLYPQLHHPLEELIYRAQKDLARYANIHAPFWLAYLDRCNVSLQEREKAWENDKDRKEIEERRRRVVAERTLDKGSTREEYEREVRHHATTLRTLRSQMSWELEETTRLIKETTFSPIFGYSVEKQMILEPVVAENYQKIMRITREDLREPSVRNDLQFIPTLITMSHTHTTRKSQ